MGTSVNIKGCRGSCDMFGENGTVGMVNLA